MGQSKKQDRFKFFTLPEYKSDVLQMACSDLEQQHKELKANNNIITVRESL